MSDRERKQPDRPEEGKGGEERREEEAPQETPQQRQAREERRTRIRNATWAGSRKYRELEKALGKPADRDPTQNPPPPPSKLGYGGYGGYGAAPALMAAPGGAIGGGLWGHHGPPQPTFPGFMGGYHHPPPAPAAYNLGDPHPGFNFAIPAALADATRRRFARPQPAAAAPPPPPPPPPPPNQPGGRPGAQQGPDPRLEEWRREWDELWEEVERLVFGRR